jgi:hypothetical protein
MRAAWGVVLIAVCPNLIAAQWTTSVEKDEMTNERMYYATSASRSPSPAMDFPYSDTRAWLGFGCKGESEWVFIGFSNQPNLVNTETGDGYNSFEARVKWDDQVETMRFSQKWGASFIHFSDDAAAVAKITEATSVLLELDWYSNGHVYFRFSLRGASAAIAKARASCASKQLKR